MGLMRQRPPQGGITRGYTTIMIRRHHLRSGVGLFAAMTLFVAACGGDDDADTPTTTAAEETATETTSPEVDDSDDQGTDDQDAVTDGACTATVAGTELNLGVFVPTGSLDPLRSSGALVGGTDLAAIYDTLMRWDADTNSWVPHAAESLEPNADFTEWTLTLREGVTYSNGDELLAGHVLENFERMLGPGANASRGLIERVDLEASEVIDDRTVVFRLFNPWVEFGYILGDAPGMVVNPAVGSEIGEGDITVISTDPQGAGIGPYVVDSFTPGESPYLVLKARDDYWGGPVCIETVNMVYIAADQPKFEALELGELDLAFLRTANVVADARATGDYDEALFFQSAGEILLINNGVGTHDPVTADKRFRQAVNLAIDPEVISDRAFGGELIGSKSMIDERSAFFSGVPGVEADLDAARAIVDELKAEGWDGTIRLNCRDTNPNLPVALVASLEAVGMEVDATVTDQNSSIGAVIQQDFDIACWGWSISDSALYRQLDFNFRSDAASNRMGFQSAGMDEALNELFAATDLDGRRDAIAKMSEIFNEETPSVVYAALEEGYVISDRVAGIIPTQQSVLLLHGAYIVD